MSLSKKNNVGAFKLKLKLFNEYDLDFGDANFDDKNINLLECHEKLVVNMTATSNAYTKDISPSLIKGKISSTGDNYGIYVGKTVG